MKVASRRVHGFTLLELIIGLALLGMLLLLLFGALRLGSLSWDAGEKRLTSTATQSVVSSFLRRSLSQTYPWRFKHADGEVLAFEGDTATLRYAGPVPTRQGIAGLHLVSLELVDGAVSMRWRVPSLDAEDFGALAEAEPMVLLRDIKELTLSYFGAQEAQAEPAWHDNWHSDQYLPSLIRVSLTPLEGEPWPDIVVATMLPSSANCHWDDFHKRCLDQSFMPVSVVSPASARREKR